MKNLHIILVLFVAGALASCDPSEDRETLGKVLTPADLKYSVTQNPEYENEVYLEDQTKAGFPYWEYVIGTSTREKDTVIFPFAGDYWIKYSAFGRAGASPKDSTQINIPENDPYYFADPSWELLTNGVNGKYWKLARITLGPASSYESIWTDVGWWPAEVTNWDDSAYFDLNGNFNYIRYHNGVATKSLFDLELNEVLTGSAIPDPGQAIAILGGNQMPIKDGSGEMAGPNKARYRIYKLTADTLIVGQGAYYTASRTTEDWGFFHWYVPAE